MFSPYPSSRFEPAPVSTQLPIQQLPEALYGGKGVRVTIPLLIAPRLRMRGDLPPSLMSLDGK